MNFTRGGEFLPPSREYFDALDGVRALCIILTLLAHTPNSPPWINGVLGVDVFFALSGFLITTLLLREQRAGHGVCLSCFYIRRFFRIVPVYFLTITLYGISAYYLFTVRGVADNWSDFTHAFPYLISFNSEYRSSDGGNILGHAWTLGIEEKYYVMWPLFILLAAWKPRVLVLLLISFLVVLPFQRDFELRGYGGLLFGSLIAIASQSERYSVYLRAIPTSVATIFIIGAIALCTWLPISKLYIVVGLSGAILVAKLASEPSLVARTLSSKPLRYIGALTFTIYLMHRLIGHSWDSIFRYLGIVPTWYIHFIAVYLSSIAVGVIVGFAFEQPMIGLGRRFSRRAHSWRLQRLGHNQSVQAQMHNRR